METEADKTEGAPADAPGVSAKEWHDRLAEYAEKLGKWHEQCKRAADLYSRRSRSDNADREYAIFWANIEVLKPAVYARTPVPVVAPRFKDRSAIAREAADVLERSLVVNFEQADLDGLMREVRDEFLLYSRGTAWVRLVDGDRVEYDHVNYDDFAHACERKWREVSWVARRAWLTRKEGVARFGDKFEDVPIGKREDKESEGRHRKKAAVWEIWCRASGMVYWISTDYPDYLDVQPPPFNLAGFWPCPRPAFATLEPKTLIPVPEIRQYKDQLEEINEYTSRIAALSQALRMKGFYLAGQGDVSTAIEKAIKSTDDRAILVPVASAAALGAGSFKDSIVWLPVREIIELVRGLVELRRVIIEDVYQITGISDIVRGSTEASETATAQQIKAQWGSQRIRDRQNELARFARDLTRIAAEMMAENARPETLREMSQTELPDQETKLRAQQIAQQAQAAQQPIPDDVQAALMKPRFDEVMAFLSNDRARGFVIEIETDSTIQPDEDADKQRRIEFVTTVGGLFQQAAPLIMQAPQLGPFMAETLKFAAAGFRAGRPLEAAIDELAEQLKSMAGKAAQPQEPPPDPAVELKKAELEMKKAEAEQRLALDGQRAQFEQEKAAADVAMKREQMAADLEIKRESMAAEIAMKREFGAAELDMKRQTAGADVALRARAQIADEDRRARDYEDKRAEAEMEAGSEDAEDSAILTGLAEMAQSIREMGEAIVKSNSAPRRKSVIGSKGQRYDIIDEPAGEA